MGNTLATKKEISQQMGKIHSVIFNMAQERRIRSEELDDFNQAYRRLIEKADSLLMTVELMEQEALDIDRIKKAHIAQFSKMAICLELCGMTKAGIRQLMDFPMNFLELAMTLRLRMGKGLETDHDFIWLNNLWKSLAIQIENDLESFKEADFFKKLYSEAEETEIKNKALDIMRVYAENLHYLKSKLGKEANEKEIKNFITLYWYENYRHNTTEENC